jgi:ribonuclease P protein component
VGKATVRNRAKRRLRSIFRDLDFLNCGTYIFVAKAGIDSGNFNKIDKDIKFALKKIGAIDN